MQNALHAGEVRHLFDEVYGLSEEKRAARLAIEEDEAVRAEVEHLLEAASEGSALLPPFLPLGSENEADRMIGTQVSHFRIESHLGSGGMGVVYRARDLKLDRPVALKFLPPELTRSEEARTRFIMEAKAASALDHPHICTIYEIGETDDGRTFIAMACYEGETLKDRIARGPLPVEESLRYARQMAEGLQAAHAKDIVHRDVKPGNVMITPEGELKLLDFGLAKLSGTTLTKTGSTIGTVAYMSPEQARGEAVDHRTDLWSLGVVFYEMLTGVRPFPGEYEMAVIYAIINEPLQPPAIPGRIESEEIFGVVDRLLQKNPADRYQDSHALIADLDALNPARNGLPEQVKQSRRVHPRRILLHRYQLLTLSIAIAAGIGIWLFRLNIPGRAEASVAVLPLNNLSGDPSKEYFSDGMTIQLISDLGKVGALQVTSITSAMRYKHTDKQLSEIARELGVTHVVEGSVTQTGGKVRVIIQLIEAETDRQIWTDSFVRELKDILVLQGQMAKTIAMSINVRLSPREQERLASARPVNPEAHDAFLKGMFYLYKLTVPDLENALQYFELAIERDPEYAPAYAGVAMVWQGRMQNGFVSVDEARPKSLVAAEKALSLDSTLAEIQNMLGWTSTWGTWEWDKGERAFQQAIALNPNYPDPRAYYSHLLQYRGNSEEAMAQIELALKLDPFNPVFKGFYGMNLVYEHRYDQAITVVREVLSTSPNDPVAWPTLRTALHMKGSYEEALEEWRAYYRARRDTVALTALERGNEEGGYRGAMRRIAETMVARSRTKYVPSWQIGTLYTRAGNIDQALAWLAKAYDEHDPNMPYISVDPLFDRMRDDPRFQALLRRMKF